MGKKISDVAVLFVSDRPDHLIAIVQTVPSTIDIFTWFTLLRTEKLPALEMFRACYAS